MSIDSKSLYSGQLSSQKMSPLLKEKLVFIGQLDCYERGSAIANFLLNINTNDTAIYRLTDEIGEQSEKLIEDMDFREEIELSSEDNLYVQCDGSMLLTREKGWKEVKLGRVFSSSSVLPHSTEKQWIKSSEYVAHLGGHERFENRMSALIDDLYRRQSSSIVFVADGAKWIWSWCESEYPKAIQILDFYHAMEHIGKFIKSICKHAKEQDKYMSTLGRILKTKGVKSVENYLSNIPRNTAQKEKEYSQLSCYIANNSKRMNYPQYIQQGYIIGSGAIESAHRTVLQRRMKQAGQRWSIQGLRNMINLRVLYMSGYKDKVCDLFIKNAA